MALVLVGCSTALLVDTPYDDDPQPEAGVSVDAGASRDASVPRDASTPRDGSTSRDAGSGSSDGGATRDAGVTPDFPRNCQRDLPSNGIANLLIDDCSTRPMLPCADQAQLDSQLARVAQGCRVPRGASIGVIIAATGCPELLTYDSESVRGQVSLCLQAVLESVRVACPNRCALFSGR